MTKRERLFLVAIGNFVGAALNIGIAFWLVSLELPPYVQTFAAGFGCGVGFMCLADWKDASE